MILSIVIFTPVMVLAETIDMLDYQINELTRRRDALRAEIDACKQNTKKFKIAGISTLGATGVGVVSNIALHNKIQNMGGGGGGTSGGGGELPKNNMSEDEADAASCREFVAQGIPREIVIANIPGCEQYI